MMNHPDETDLEIIRCKDGGTAIEQPRETSPYLDIPMVDMGFFKSGDQFFARYLVIYIILTTDCEDCGCKRWVSRFAQQLSMKKTGQNLECLVREMYPTGSGCMSDEDLATAKAADLRLIRFLIELGVVQTSAPVVSF